MNKTKRYQVRRMYGSLDCVVEDMVTREILRIYRQNTPGVWARVEAQREAARLNRETLHASV